MATATFTLAQTAATIAVKRLSTVAFIGDAGTGKTHALEQFRASCPIPVITVTAQANPTRKELYEEILAATGTSCGQLSARELRRECQELLEQHPRVLAIDECQHLPYLWHQQLRGLHDAPETQFALILSGGRSTARALKRDPQLWTRLQMRVDFRELTGAELVRTLSAFHPMLARTDEQVLLDLDAADCHGNFRNWSEIVDLAQAIQPGATKLTGKLIRAIRALRAEL